MMFSKIFQAIALVATMAMATNAETHALKVSIEAKCTAEEIDVVTGYLAFDHEDDQHGRDLQRRNFVWWWDRDPTRPWWENVYCPSFCRGMSARTCRGFTEGTCCNGIYSEVGERCRRRMEGAGENKKTFKITMTTEKPVVSKEIEPRVCDSAATVVMETLAQHPDLSNECKAALPAMKFQCSFE